tara:strand:+ start:493 stop:1818 length:1326 start_codon:yes stop_codon:yes gene_type:complete
MGGYIGARSGVGLVNTTLGSVQDLTATDASPEVTLINNTHEDSDGGRESKVIFKGQQSGGEESTLAEIEANHSGSADDEKANLIFRTNDGSDGSSPTEAMRIQSDQKIGVGLSSNISSQLHVNSEVSLGPDNNNRMILGSTSGGVGSIGTIEAGTASFSTATFKGGKVGIGVADPTAPLTVKSPSNAEAIHVVGRSDDIGQMKFFEADHTTILATLEARNSFVNFGSVANIPTKFMTNNTERFIITEHGDKSMNPSSTPAQVGNGTHTGSYFTSVGEYNTSRATTSTSVHVRLYNTNGQVGRIETTGSQTNYITSSDYRLKENVTNITNGITKVKQLAPKRFNFIADPDTTVDGFIAHETQAVVPEAVSGVKDGVEIWNEADDLPDNVSVGDNKLDADGNTIPVMQGIDQAKLVPLLTAALQEAIAKIETLETKVAALEAE